MSKWPNTIEIRKSVGSNKQDGNVWLYAVLVNGKTRGSFTSSDRAEQYAEDLLTRFPAQRTWTKP